MFVPIAGPAVVVGVTMYVLSISSLSEVEMVQKHNRAYYDLMMNVHDSHIAPFTFFSFFRLKAERDVLIGFKPVWIDISQLLTYLSV